MGKGSGKRRPDEYTHAFKVLCPEELVALLMGKGGLVKDALQEETGAKLMVSQRDEYFPGTQLRILTVLHDDSDGICGVLSRMVDNVVECTKSHRPSATPAVTGEQDFVGKDAGTYVFRVAVSPRMARNIIGPKGTKVAQMREECQAEIGIAKEISLDHQRLKVVASPEGIMRALQLINVTIQEEASSASFKDWVLTDFPRTGDSEARGRQRQGVASEPPERERSPRRNQSQRDSRESGYQHDPRQADIDVALGIIDNAFQGFPEGTLDEEHVITCDLPVQNVSAMIGKKGAFVKEVRKITRTQIHFEEASSAPGSAETQTMTIQGKIPDTYRAHVMMMQKYVEVEEAQKREAEPQVQPEVEDLQRQLLELQQKLEAVKTQSTGAQSQGQSKGKGKRGKKR
jgi:RNA-binding protein Nova